MSDLFDKISTLVNAQLNDYLGRSPRSPLARIKLNAEEAEQNPQRSARGLRQRLEEAIDYEDELQARIDNRMREVFELDKLVDEMLRSGDEYSAQRLQGQLNMKQQQLTIAESELRDHRLLTQHLMQELSTLERALDNQEQRSGNQSGQRASATGQTRIPIDGAASARGTSGGDNQSILDTVSDKFEETRSNLESLLGNSPVSEAPERSSSFQRFEIIDEEPDPRKPKPRKNDAPDMNARLSRLSKPSEGDD
jgi:chromosome segregation ATPase